MALGQGLPKGLASRSDSVLHASAFATLQAGMVFDSARLSPLALDANMINKNQDGRALSCRTATCASLLGPSSFRKHNEST